MKITRELIHALPKTDLHVHLDGSVRIDSLLEMADERGIKLPETDPDKLMKLVSCDENTASLEEYLQGFHIINMVLQDRDSLYRAAYELAEDASKENIRYMEVRYSPILHTQKGMKLTDISDAVIEGLAQAEKDFNIKTGVIICGIRNMDPETSEILARLAIMYKNRGVVGFDLAGAEYNNPAVVHEDSFKLALKNNLNITIHAGEAYGPDSIHQALHYCGTHRIGHGTRLFEDGDLLNYVNDHRIPLEVCLVSNLHTKAVHSLKEHPASFYLSYGLRVTLNTDNRIVSNTTLTDEYMVAVEKLGFSYQDVKNVIINGYKSAFIHYKERVKLLNKALEEIKEIEEKFHEEAPEVDAVI